MITGNVSQELEDLITVDVEDGNGASHSLEVVVDAGFTGYLVLPQAVISRLGLRFSGRRSVTIASVAQITVDAYAGIVSSHERWRNGIVLESSSESLIVMSLYRVAKLPWMSGLMAVY
jgi:predicted aspartyl protease